MGEIINSKINLFKDEILSAGRQGEELLAEIRKKTEMCVDRVGNISSIERLVDTIFHLNCFHQLND